MSLEYIGNQCTIYVGSVLLLIGVVGNGMNIFIFSSVSAYRTNPCTFYFLVGSIHNILYILINLTIRIAGASSNIDISRKSLLWCKIYSFLVVYLGLTSFTCSCLTTIDQFLATSQHAYLRRCSNIRWTHRIMFIVIIIWCLHGIPILVTYNIPPATKTCGSTNPTFASYSLLYALIYLSIIPAVVMIIFGYLTYRNIHETVTLVRQRVDRQLLKMILMQVMLVFISMTPFGTYTIYRLITVRSTKSKNQLLQESFASTILILVTYFYYVVC